MELLRCEPCVLLLLALRLVAVAAVARSALLPVASCILYFSIMLTFALKICLLGLSILRTYIICKTQRKSCKSEYNIICIRYSA